MRVIELLSSRRTAKLIGSLLAAAAIVGGAWFATARFVGSGGDGTPAARIVETQAPGGKQVGATEGDVAADFDAALIDGGRGTLAQFRGRAVVLNFWASWCTSCLDEIPELQRLQDQQPQALAVVGVNVDETRGEARLAMRDRLDARYPSFLDPDRTLANRYHVTGVPVSVFIDKDGVVRKVIQGQLDYAIFDRFARVAMGQQDVPGVNDPLPLRFFTPLPPDG